MKKLFHLVFAVSIFNLLSLGLIGCGGSSNDPILSSVITEGNGYKITITSSVQTVPPGGTALISALVMDPSGKPIKDDEEVIFSSNQEGTIEGATDGKAKTKQGIATVIFRAPATAANTDKPAPSKANRIFASYLGALSYVEITLVSTTF